MPTERRRWLKVYSSASSTCRRTSLSAGTTSAALVSELATAVDTDGCDDGSLDVLQPAIAASIAPTESDTKIRDLTQVFIFHGSRRQQQFWRDVKATEQI